MGNFALPLPLADRKTGEGGDARRRPWAAALGLGGSHGEGKKERRLWGTCSPP